MSIHIPLTMLADRTLSVGPGTAGIDGENNATVLDVTVPAAYSAWYKYIHCEAADGTKKEYGPYGSSGATEFSAPLYKDVLVEGRLLISVVLKTGADVFKSDSIALPVGYASNATDTEIDDNPDVIQALIERVAEAEARAAAAIAAAQQAVADILAMRGTDLATLTGGKLTPAQIPALSINDVFEVADTDAMLALEAERGDCALIITDAVVTNSYILASDDPTDINNWKKLGVSYVANAGHANTANSAENALTVNGHRFVRFETVAEMEAAAKVPGTIYFAPYPQEV